MTHGLTEPGMEGRGTRRGAFRRRCTEARGQKNNTPSTLHGDGSQSRDFTYVDDIARGTVLAGKLFGSQLSTLNPQLRDPVAPTYNIINLGGGNNPLSITAMIGIIEAALGKKAKINAQPASAADMAATWADISKAKRLLGWTPQTNPEDGLRKSVDWHMKNQQWLKAISL